MLQNIREKFTGVVALVILGAIALSFVFVGLNYSFIGQSFAAKVDGEDISLAQFENAYRDQLQERPELAQLPATIRQTLRGRILEQLIQQRVVDNYLSESGYIISDEQLARSIQQTPDFQVDGKFDMEAYRSLLAQFGQEPAGFERSQRVGLRRDQLQRAVRGSAILTPAEFRRYLNLAGEQRIVTIARLTADAVADGITITDDVVTAYYDANPSMFQLPESADARVADICEAFLGFSAKNHAPDTYRNHHFYIQSFCDTAGLLPVLELRQFHVTRWIEANGYRIAGPCREVYLRAAGNGSQTDPQTVTEIQFPVDRG